MPTLRGCSFHVLALLGAIFAFPAPEAGASSFLFRRPASPLDRGELTFADSADAKPDDTGPLRANGWAEYDFEVPGAGWYVLSFQDMPDLAREVFVDGRRVSFTLGQSAKSVAENASSSSAAPSVPGAWAKEANLPLAAGSHTLRVERIGRMGYPFGFPRAWEMRASSGAADRIAARLIGPSEVRLGEPLRLELTAGAWTGPVAWELFRRDELTGKESSACVVSFAATSGFTVRQVEIPTPTEGVFTLHARTAAESGSAELSRREFLDGACFVVDTASRPMRAAEAAGEQNSLLHVIDCVAGTLDGRALVPGENYWEANGPTRVARSPAGVYRESNDGRGHGVEPHPRGPAEAFSGFAYLVDVPPALAAAGRPLLIEIDHPDDDWRSVCVSLVDVMNADPARPKGYLPPAFAFETGGNLALSNRTLTEKIFFWPNGRRLHLGLVSARLGKRAAASAIRIYSVDTKMDVSPESALPGRVAAPADAGRISAVYMEEHERWHTHFNTPPDRSRAVRDWIGLNRTLGWIAHTGQNAFWPTVAAYQTATYDSAELRGYLLQHHNIPRLTALLCEKYGLAYVAELFFAEQLWFDRVTMTEGADKPDDLYARTWWGFSRGDAPDDRGFFPRWNVLHPRVQRKIVAIYGELADTLRDTPAFVGMGARLDAWQWGGHFALSSLNWGYEDWTIAEFERDTGLRVPGAPSDPARFEQRYRFLTSAEQLPGWQAWRGARVSSFLRQLAARIRQARPDATLFLSGDGNTDNAHLPGIPTDIRERLLGMGVDLAVFAEDPSIAFLPAGNYGRGKTFTFLADQRAYDRFADPANLAAGRNAVRGFSANGGYQEWAAEFPLGKLGMPLSRWWYCSGSDAAGLNALERLAQVLAEQDTMVMRDGGYTLLHGHRDYFARWMAAYTALPRLPFQPSVLARDPVALWTRDDPAGFLFYIVNRERYSVTLRFRLAAAPVDLVTGEILPALTAVADANAFTHELTLAPFELRAFRAPAGATIAATETISPSEAVAFLRRRLAFAQTLERRLASDSWHASLSLAETAAFRAALRNAADAVDRGAWWRARTVLASAPMMAVYEKTGGYPEDQVRARFPNLLEPLKAERFDPDEPFLDASALLECRAPGETAALVASEEFNSEWRSSRVLRGKPASEALTLEIPVAVPGVYQLSLGVVVAPDGDAEALAVTFDGQALSAIGITPASGEPGRLVLPKLELPAGRARLAIRLTSSSAAVASAFGLYALKLTPDLRPLPSTDWSTIGPFPADWHVSVAGTPAEQDAVLRRDLERVLPPERDPDLALAHRVGDRELHWRQTDRVVGRHEEAGVNFAQRAGIPSRHLGLAQTFITNPDSSPRDAILYLGCDWWANVWLNGVQLQPEAARAQASATGAWFSQWKPRPVPITLRPGLNRILVKIHGGSSDCWFICRITDAGGLRVSPTPPSSTLSVP